VQNVESTRSCNSIFCNSIFSILVLSMCIKKTFYTKCICILRQYVKSQNIFSFYFILYFFYLKNASNWCLIFQYFNIWTGTKHWYECTDEQFFYTFLYIIVSIFYNFFCIIYKHDDMSQMIWQNMTSNFMEKTAEIRQDGDERRWKLNFACKNMNYTCSLFFSCAFFSIIYRMIYYLIENIWTIFL